MWSSLWEQASEEVILSVVQVGQHFENKTKARSARNRTTKTPKRRANAAKHRPAAQAERTEKTTTTTCTTRDAEMVAGAVDPDIDAS